MRIMPNTRIQSALVSMAVVVMSTTGAASAPVVPATPSAVKAAYIPVPAVGMQAAGDNIHLVQRGRKGLRGKGRRGARGKGRRGARGKARRGARGNRARGFGGAKRRAFRGNRARGFGRVAPRRYYGRRRGRSGAAVAAGIAGLIIGGAIAASRREYRNRWEECDARYRTFRWSDGTYIPYVGAPRELCPYLRR